jgi:hypothetical protein
LESLTCVLDPISSGAAPSGLTAVFLNGKVLLSWWGSAYATSYVVQRGTASGGPYTTLASGITDPRSYEDSGMSAGTYYYIVRANSTSGPASNQVSITTGNPLIAYSMKQVEHLRQIPVDMDIPLHFQEMQVLFLEDLTME